MIRTISSQVPNGAMRIEKTARSLDLMILSVVIRLQPLLLISLLIICEAIMVANEAAAAEPLRQRFGEYEWPTDCSPDCRPYRYRLYVPQNSTSAERLPLLVWFHGAGEAGEDNISSLRWLSLVFESANDNPPLLILVTQHRSGKAWAASDYEQSGDALSVTYGIIKHILTEYSVDPNRVYLAGVSSGGNACWTMAMRHPSEFAACAPMSAGGADYTKAALLKTVPVWAFNSDGDPPRLNASARSMVLAIQQLGGCAAWTETAKLAYSHDSWTAAFKDYQLLSWLLAQRRDAPLSYRPGALPLRVAITAAFEQVSSSLWVVLPLVMIIGIVVIRNRRR